MGDLLFAIMGSNWLFAIIVGFNLLIVAAALLR